MLLETDAIICLLPDILIFCTAPFVLLLFNIVCITGYVPVAAHDNNDRKFEKQLLCAMFKLKEEFAHICWVRYR